MVRTWLITGGCGFIGSSLIARLIKQRPEDQIRVLDNLSVGSRDELNEVCEYEECEPEKLAECKGVFLIVGDIVDQEICRAVCHGVDVIVHLAANTGVGPSVEDPRTDMLANVCGTFNMLESARLKSVNHFVFASSGAPAGIVDPPIHEEIAPHPVSPYGASKLAGEGYCSAYYQTYRVKTVALRFGNVYGPRSKNKASVVAKFIKQALNGEPCEIYGDGSQTRDFIYIEDLVDAIVKASTFDGGGEVFQIAAGVELTLNELVEQLKKVFKTCTGSEMTIVHGDKRLGDVMRNYADTSKAKKLLGWWAKTSLEEGLLKTLNDFV